MSKRWLTVLTVLMLVLAVTGCSSESKPSESGTYQTIVMPGNQYVLPVEEQTFYCMRVGDHYFKFVYPGCYATVLLADDRALFPDIESGHFALVTADVEETESEFGFFQVKNSLSTRIVSLKASEPMDFDAITKVFDVTDAGSEEINIYFNLFQYTHKGKLYIIFVYQKQVTAYSEDGLFIEYTVKDGEEQFERFLR